MIITCPNCRTTFRINPASLGAQGRTVRCSSCAHRWFVEPFTQTVVPAAVALAQRQPRPDGSRRPRILHERVNASRGSSTLAIERTGQPDRPPLPMPR